MKVLHSFSELSATRNQINGTLGLVPTMGALHDGHLSLIKKIRPHVDNVMVTIFVNPTQFGPNEDFSKYPRQQQADLAKLEGQADYVYLPQVDDIYPDGSKSTIHISGITEILEGKFRPGHFDGVATVVDRLFRQTKPSHAIFGEKDYQQLMVIKQMTAEQNHPIEILSAPTLREVDGLATSSRNAYLSAEERKTAALIYRNLKDIQSGQNSIDTAITNLETAGFDVQYLTSEWNRLLVAAYLGKTRLIDNIPLKD